MPTLPTPPKSFYSLGEVAEICDRPPGLIRRWVFRRQLAVVWLDETPLVPAAALQRRLDNPPRVERALRRRRRVTAGDGSA